MFRELSMSPPLLL